MIDSHWRRSSCLLGRLQWRRINRGYYECPNRYREIDQKNINSLEMSRISESDSHDDVMSRDDFRNSFYAIIGFVHRKWIAPESQCGKYHLHDVHDEVRLVKQAAPAILTTFINSPYFFSPSFRYLFDGTSLLIINLKQAFPCSLWDSCFSIFFSLKVCWTFSLSQFLITGSVGVQWICRKTWCFVKKKKNVWNRRTKQAWVVISIIFIFNSHIYYRY